MSDSTDKHVGFFIVPAEHLDELHALEAAIEEADSHEDYFQRLDWSFYRGNQLFERAKEVATASTVIEDSTYMDAFLALHSWFLRRFRDGDQRDVLNPDELAPVVHELPGIRVDDVLRWMRKPRQIRRKAEPLAIELFEALRRTVAAAPAAPSGFAMLTFYEKYRHPPAPLPPEPEPEPEPPDLDEGALLGWFLVPAKHIPALQDIAAARDTAFRQERWADFFALESRLFEQARAVAKTSDVFNAWAYRAAHREWWIWLQTIANPIPPTILGPGQRDTWAYWLSRRRHRLEDLLPGVCEKLGKSSEADLARARELFEALRRVARSRRAKGCGLVIAWWFEKPPTWPRYDDAHRRATWIRTAALIAQMHEAEAQLRAIEAKRNRAKARAQDAAPDQRQTGTTATKALTSAKRTAAGSRAKARGKRALSSAERAAVAQARDELARRFPWLCRLQNNEDVLAAYAQQIAWSRKAKDAGQHEDNPAEAAAAQPARMPIVLADLLAEGFFDGDAAVERAARQAMAAEIARHPAWVELVLPRRGKPDVRVYLDDQRLRLQDGRLPADAFFARGTGRGGGALLDVQAAWHQAVVEEGRRTLGVLYEPHPDLAGMRLTERFEQMISESVLKRLDREQRREQKARARRR